MANPPIQFVMWTRDKHLLEPYEEEGFAVMNNGSLLIDRVKESHQGQYTCTPYNVYGTKGSSQPMQVIVKEPPKFDVTPEPMYQTKLGASLEIPCSAVAPNGTNPPLITWHRVRNFLTLSLHFHSLSYLIPLCCLLRSFILYLYSFPRLLLMRLLSKRAVGLISYYCQSWGFYRGNSYFFVSYWSHLNRFKCLKCGIAWICLQKDGRTLPRDRVRVVEGSLMIENVHEIDFGEYECIASNEVATLVFTTKIYVEGAPPQAPYNVTGNASVFAVTLTWMPGFAADPSQQKHIVR